MRRPSSIHRRRCVLDISILLSLLALLAPTPARAAPGNDNERPRAWAERWLAGDHDAAIALIEQDLTSDAPHPLASSAWVYAHWLRGNLEPALDEVPPAIADLVETGGRLRLLRDDDRHREVVRGVTPDIVAQESDPLILYQWFWASREIDEAAIEAAVVARFADLFPQSDLALDAALHAVRSSNRTRELLRARFVDGASTPPTRAERAVREVIEWGYGVEDFEESRHMMDAASSRAWLLHQPDSFTSLGNLGQALWNQYRFDESLSRFEQSTREFPFFSIAQYPAAILINRDEVGRARELLARQEGIRGRRLELRLAQAAELAGDMMLAREILGRLIESEPEWPEPHAALASIEHEAQRYPQAVELARRALDLAPDNMEIIEQLARSLRAAGRPEDCIALIEARTTPLERNNAGGTGQWLYYEHSRALRTLGEHGRARELLEQACAAYPNSAWMANLLAESLWDLGLEDDAIDLAERALRIDVLRAYAASVMSDWLVARRGSTEARRTMERLAEEWPGVLHLTLRIARLQPSPASKLATYEQAAARNPGRWWAASHLAWELFDQGRMQQALDLLAAFEPARPGDGAHAINTTLDMARRADERGVPLPKPLGAYLDDQRHLDGSDFDRRHILEVRQLPLFRMGMTSLAVEEAMEYHRIDPDSPSPLTFARNALGTEAPARWEGSAWRRFADRDHFDADRLEHVIHTHAMWNGSPVEAARYAELLKQFRPERFADRARAEIGRIHARYGDSRTAFVDRYGPTTGSIAPSERYVNWYESARQRALAGGSPRVIFDFDAGTVTSRQPGHPDAVHGFDPITGKRTLVQSGSAWIRLAYDRTPAAKLTGIETSTGESVRLTYNNDGRIIRMQTGESSELLFEYDERGEPVRIEIPERGWLIVEYDERGEIASIETTSLSGEAEVVLAQAITSAFNEMRSLVSAVDSEPGTLWARFEPPDPALEPLIDRIRRARSNEEYLAAILDLAEHRLELSGQHLGYGLDARSDLDEAIELLETGGVSDPTLTARTLTLWHTLHASLYLDGIDLEQLVTLTRLSNLLDRRIQEVPDPELLRARTLFDTSPLARSASARWLPGSDLDSPGYWRHWKLSELLPGSRLLGGRPTAALITSSGELIVATTRGLCVRRQGWWEWYGFRDDLGRFSRDTGAPHSAVSEILALAETDDRTLWIGTANGILALPPPDTHSSARDFTARPRRIITAQDGLPAPRVEHLAAIDGIVLAGTDAGLARITPQPTLLADRPVRFLSASWRADSEGFLFGTEQGVFSLESAADAAPTPRADTPADAALWTEDGQGLILQTGRSLRWGRLDEQGRVRSLAPMPDAGAVSGAGDLHGLARVRATLNSGPSLDAPAALSDSGLLIFRNNTFELLEVRVPDSVGDAIGVASALDTDTGRASWLTLSTDGVHLFEQSSVLHPTTEWVRDLLSVDQWGLTFVATGSSLHAVSHDTGEYVLFRYISSTQLAAAEDGTLYTNDGSTILRFTPGSAFPDPLFDATSSAPEQWRMTSVQDICVAGDGTLWVASGPSVFRLAPGETEPEEFCYFTEPNRFRARSPYIDAVFETVDGTIRVTASDEGHLHDDLGAPLIGGVLQLDRDRFVRVDDEAWSRDNSRLFWRSYTPIDNDTAIAASNTEFHIIRNGWLTDPLAARESSYETLYRSDSRLWMGTRGARFPGEDLWLFGCARGVIGYRNGTWLALDRLNSLLPRNELRKYGSRHTYAIATDPRGRIYVGTSLGLLVYESGGDATSLLFSEGSTDLAAVSLEREKLRSQSDILVRGMLEHAPDSPNAELVRRLREQQERIERLRTRSIGVKLERASAGMIEDPADRSIAGSAPELPRLEAELARRFRSLEREDPSLAAMLQLKPLEISSLRNRLPEGVSILQILPSRDTLYINVVSKDRFESRQADVGREELFEVAQRAAQLFRFESRVLRGLEQTVRPSHPDDADTRHTQLRADLAWLYNTILLPVERDLEGVSVVIFCPVGPLAYVPPAAFIREHQGSTQYAVERHSFSTVHDLYLLLHSLEADPSLSSETLVIGDPDGSLPGARAEAERVHQLAGGNLELLLGDDATTERMSSLAVDARIVHLATHGRLDSRDPIQSGLLFADRELKIYEIDALNLDEVDLAVLSACESGLGPEGLEYATLARAFVGAGAQRSIATLWQINDAWAERLMREFYQFLIDGEPPHEALARAQRRLIQQHGRDTHPATWAGYTLFGAPGD